MKKLHIIFIAACMLVCLVPFVGMAFHPTKESTENRRLSEFPSATAKDGGLNLDFFKEFDTWFNEHFAFRNELVAADGVIQGTIFKTSAEEQVIYGTDGWLYYSSTLGDYQGTNCMDERERFNLQHNLGIVSSWAKEKGVELLLTVPPNKNTLYGEHMPYYDAKIVDPSHTLDYLPEICKASKTHYADLAKLFRNEDETLYLKRDSHWNGKGALLAYNAIMEQSFVQLNRKYLIPKDSVEEEGSYPDGGKVAGSLEWNYEDYKDAPATRAKDTDGDLNRMLYTYYGEKEMDTYYKVDQNFSYVTDTESVEDAWIETRAEGKQKTLLMFRDSFGNTLLPYMANQFGRSVFTKESPYRLEKLVTELRPNLVIMEKVERNLRDYITQPPIVSAPEIPEIEGITTGETVEAEKLEMKAAANPYDSSMVQISGIVPEEMLSTETEIILSVNGAFYQAFHTAKSGFVVYLDSEKVSENSCHVQVILSEDGKYRMISETTLSFK